MKTKQTTHFMAGIIMLLFITAFIIIAGRFLYIEATGEVSGVDLKAFAKDKRTASYVIPAERGKILDKQGMVLAYDRPVFKVYAILDPEYSKNSSTQKHVEDIEKTAKKLAPHLDIDIQEVKKTLETAKEAEKFQVEFGTKGKNLSQKEKEAIDKEEIPGIYFVEEADRYYPNGIFASHILGFAQKSDEENTISGITGIEREMDKILSGKNGHISYERDKHGVKLLNPNEIVEQAKDGNDIYLTLDQKIQTLLEDALSHIDEEYHPERMIAIVMNPKTAEILAMSSRPSFNPNSPKNVGNWYNDAISTPFEPGSTVKMFTWAAAIEEGVYNGQKTFKSGQYKPNEKIEVISDHNKGAGWGDITFDEGFARSSNVAASRLVWEEMGPSTFQKYLKDFHLDENTGIDLPGEVPGQILYNWPSEKLRTAFGQGSTVTPIQQMTAATAIANEGKMMKPYVIQKIVDPVTKEVIEEKEPEVNGQPISKETASQVKDLLDDVVNSKHGTGKKFSLQDYTVIGKTGTAQIPRTEGRGYMIGHSNYVFSFLGMAPKDDPELMMYVAVKQPDLEIGEQGSDLVSFIFTNVMQNALHYLDVNPDKDVQDEIHPVEIPKLIDQSTKETKEKLEKQGLEVILIGEGKKIVKSSVTEDESLLINDRVILITDSPKMPDMKNWSLREVHEFGHLMGLQLETIGNGFVIKQNIDPGQKIKEGDYLGVELQLPNEPSTKKRDKKQKPDNEEQSH